MWRNGDAVVGFLTIGHRVVAGGGEVADIQIHPEQWGQGHGGGEALGSGESIWVFGMVVAVHGERDLVLFRYRGDALDDGQGGGGGDQVEAHGSGHLKAAVDFLVAKLSLKLGRRPEAERRPGPTSSRMRAKKSRRRGHAPFM